MKYFAPIFIGALWCTSAQAQITLVPLHPDGVETNEPSIAIDPKYPGTQLLGSNNDLVFSSEDGGRTWVPKRLDPAEGFYGDPVVYIAADGTQFICHLARNKDKTWPHHFDRIVLERSTDNGKTFTSNGVGYNAGKVQDKPWVFVDEGKKSKFRNRVYLSWTEFDKYASRNSGDSSRIRVAYSTNGGASFDTVITVSDSCGDAADDDNTLEGATLAAGPRGELYLVWAGRGKIWMDKSLDGGKTWGKDMALCQQKGGWNLTVNGLMRSNSMPFVVADNKGKIYVVFGDERYGDQDIFYLYSKDKGITWTPPTRVNNDAMRNGKDQYMPHLAIDKKTNKVYVVFYDRRNSDLNRYTDVYVATLNQEKPGPNVRITGSSFCAPGKAVFFGDYITVAAARDEVRVAFTSYDHDKLFPTVLVGIAKGKTLRSKSPAYVDAYVEFIQLKDTDQLYIHFNIPEAKSCTVEMSRGNQVFFKQLFNPLTAAENEVMLPVSKFPGGVYHLEVSFKGRKINKDVYIDRR
jgi:hypothetical protein